MSLSKDAVTITHNVVVMLRLSAPLSGVSMGSAWSSERVDADDDWVFKDHAEQLCALCRLEGEESDRTISLEDVHRGSAEQCICCALLWDAFEMWNKHAQVPLDQVGLLDIDFTDPGFGLMFGFQMSERHLDLSVSRNAGSSYQPPSWSANVRSMLPFGGDTSSAHSFSILQTWLEISDQDHKCVSHGTYPMPKRLLSDRW